MGLREVHEQCRCVILEADSQNGVLREKVDFSWKGEESLCY